MSVAFYSSDSDSIHQEITATNLYGTDESIDRDDFYEISRCVDWINDNNFEKVAFQFPDNLLKDADYIVLKLKECTEKEFFILGDTSYGSCCVDEIAAEHASANAIIHYGHACLSPSQRLPVLYVFGKGVIDVCDTVYNFKKLFPDTSSHVIIVYEVVYSHAIRNIAQNLKEYENLVVSELKIPNKESESSSEENLTDNQVKFTKCQRHFIIKKSNSLCDYSIFYIGTQNITLTNVMLSLNECRFFTYHPNNKTGQPETLDVNKYLKKRYYYIEKTKDAKIIGILGGTLGVSNYLTIINHLRELIKGAGKKSYTLVVGKLNVAKLANFAEIEVFVNVACMESSIVDCHGFYQPIVTPYELEIALNQAREWSGDYVTDFSELLPGAAKHIPPIQIKAVESDISLITGKMRSADVNSEMEECPDESSAVVQRNEMSLSTVHSQAAGEYLSQRSWKGLEQCLGETPVADIQQGKKGIACEYEDEGNKIEKLCSETFCTLPTSEI